MAKDDYSLSRYQIEYHIRQLEGCVGRLQDEIEVLRRIVAFQDGVNLLPAEHPDSLPAASQPDASPRADS